jgi:3,4-dihydroxy 2-butanone 4-phosphate synthase/GTP cyclohydrolase II
MVEGGASVVASFLSQHLADLVLLTIAPIFVGGLHALENPVGQADSPPSHQSFPRLQDWDSERLGNDLIVWGRPAWPREKKLTGLLDCQDE